MSSHANEASNMPLDQLRAERDRLRHEEDAVSFVRRLAQGRIDLVEAVRHRKSSGESTSAGITSARVRSLSSPTGASSETDRSRLRRHQYQ